MYYIICATQKEHWPVIRPTTEVSRLLESCAVSARSAGVYIAVMTFSYSDLVLGLCVNADTVDKAEQGDWGGKGDGTYQSHPHEPFAVETLAQYDFRVRPTNYVFRVKSTDLSLYDWDAICRWYNGHNLCAPVHRYDYLVRGLHCKPYSVTLDNEPVTRFPHQQIEDDASLLVLRRHGINLQPVWVDG